MHLDIARDLLEPDSFIATAVYEDGAALERPEIAVTGAPGDLRGARCRGGARAAEPEREKQRAEQHAAKPAFRHTPPL